ncbi:MAG: hypothetical protein ACRCW9_05475 [Cetobacterium sp.]
MGKEDLIITSAFCVIAIILRVLIHILDRAIERNAGRCCGDCVSFENCFYSEKRRDIYSDRNCNEHPACKEFDQKIR